MTMGSNGRRGPPDGTGELRCTRSDDRASGTGARRNTPWCARRRQRTALGALRARRRRRHRRRMHADHTVARGPDRRAGVRAARDAGRGRSGVDDRDGCVAAWSSSTRADQSVSFISVTSSVRSGARSLVDGVPGRVAHRLHPLDQEDRHGPRTQRARVESDPGAATIARHEPAAPVTRFTPVTTRARAASPATHSETGTAAHSTASRSTWRSTSAAGREPPDPARGRRGLRDPSTRTPRGRGSDGVQPLRRVRDRNARGQRSTSWPHASARRRAAAACPHRGRSRALDKTLERRSLPTDANGPSPAQRNTPRFGPERGAIDHATKNMIAVRVAAALRMIDRSARGIDVVFT